MAIRFGTDSIKCTIYSDGMSLRNGDFRPWHASNAQSFVKDVVDGFFPSEFREMYPDGVRWLSYLLYRGSKCRLSLLLQF